VLVVALFKVLLGMVNGFEELFIWNETTFVCSSDGAGDRIRFKIKETD